MSSIDRTLKQIRPRLYSIAPHTFWFSVGFGTFNIVVGLSSLSNTIFKMVEISGLVPLDLWAAMFLLHGIALIVSLAINNWKFTKSLHFAGLFIKTGWWMELFIFTLTHPERSPFLLFAWSLLLFLQFIVCIYFTPKVESHV